MNNQNFEYSYIDDFTYDEKTHILYVRDEEKLLKYSVPSMSFLGSSDINYTTIGMVVLNPDEILANCSFWEDDAYKECFNGLCVISTSTGEIIKRCYKSDFYFCGKDFPLLRKMGLGRFGNLNLLF